MSRLSILKAVASSGSIGGWVIWSEYAFIWAAIIAASQVADALKDTFPFSRQSRAENEHILALDRILIDVELEWIRVFRGDYPEDEVIDRCRKFMMLQHDALRKNFPDGDPPRNNELWAMAEQGDRDYLSATHPTEV